MIASLSIFNSDSNSFLVLLVFSHPATRWHFVSKWDNKMSCYNTCIDISLSCRRYKNTHLHNSSKYQLKANCFKVHGAWGQHGAHLGPVGPRWAPCRPHAPCYLGSSTSGTPKSQKHLFVHYCIRRATHSTMTHTSKWICIIPMSPIFIQLISPWSIWTPFGRRYFQMHFYEWKVLYFDQNFTEICS